MEIVDGVGEFLEDLKEHTLQKYDAFTVAEVFNIEDELTQFIGEDGHFLPYLISVLINSVTVNMAGMMLLRLISKNGVK